MVSKSILHNKFGILKQQTCKQLINVLRFNASNTTRIKVIILHHFTSRVLVMWINYKHMHTSILLKEINKPQTWKFFQYGICRKTSYISRTLVGIKSVDHSDVGAAPTTSSFST